jgi:ribosomal protein L11 methyltransferase
MPWKTLAASTSTTLVEGEGDPLDTLEAFFWDNGAVSVTVVDAEDNPIFEPGPGETPVWENVTVSGLFEDDVDVTAIKAALAETTFEFLYEESLADKIWEREWLSRFEPMCFGRRLWVCPSSYEVDEVDAVVVKLDPGLAFGTGTHATTHLCLAWLDEHIKPSLTVIDFGCGSGILGIAALLLGASSVAAIDNDPQAVTATIENARRNDVVGRIIPELPKTEYTETYDVVIANILAQPLIDLAGTLVKMMKPEAHIVLSGIMSGQKIWVKEAYEALGLVFDSEQERDGWVCLAASRPQRIRAKE